MDTKILAKTIKDIAIPGKGILAADESSPTIKKRFDAIQVESTEENRRAYRELLFTTPNLGDYISGVILFEETLYQKTKDGIPFPEWLAKQGSVPGIKVDKGLVECPQSPDEKVTQGLDGLAERLANYKKAGARFAKWRVVYSISDKTPSDTVILANAESLAKYAEICQSLDIVPIVEPEVLMDGNHTIERCAEVTEKAQLAVFEALKNHHVACEYIILKPNMVTAGKEFEPNIQQAAEWTVKILRRTVPESVPSINFLSGGQSDIVATQHLNAINKLGPLPWYVSFSYGRALQAPCLKAWLGKAENVKAVQDALIKRAKLNGAATKGEYQDNME